MDIRSDGLADATGRCFDTSIANITPPATGGTVSLFKMAPGATERIVSSMGWVKAGPFWNMLPIIMTSKSKF